MVPSKMLDLAAWPVVHIRVPEHISVELLEAFELEFRQMLQRAVDARLAPEAAQLGVRGLRSRRLVLEEEEVLKQFGPLLPEALA